MLIERPVKAALAPPIGARALQQRLYREIGVAAVAAALDVATSDEATVEPLHERHTAAIFTSEACPARQSKAA